jgi:colicin import membrane protein
MNDASAVMKEWRRLQIVSASAAVMSVPDRVQQASQSALSALWTEAQELANEALHVAQTGWDAERAEAEKLRVELSSALETQGTELEALRLKLAEVEKEASTAVAAVERSRMESAQQVVALTDQAHTASARAQEIEKRAEDLKTALMEAQASEQRLTAEFEAERRQHGATREQSNAVSTELMTVKARAEAQAGVQLEQVEQWKRSGGSCRRIGCSGNGSGRGGAVARSDRGAAGSACAIDEGSQRSVRANGRARRAGRDSMRKRTMGVFD